MMAKRRELRLRFVSDGVENAEEGRTERPNGRNQRLNGGRELTTEKK